MIMDILTGPNSGTRVMQRLRLAIIAGDHRNDHTLLCCLTAIYCDPNQDVQCCTKCEKLVSIECMWEVLISRLLHHRSIAPHCGTGVVSLDMVICWVAKVLLSCNTNTLEV